MDPSTLTDYIINTFPGVETSENFGFTFFFQGADRMRPFATLASQDNEYDQVSNLNRPGIFRLNIGISRDTFSALFGTTTPTVTDYDFTALDRIMPHPVYAPQYFICVLNPGEETLQQTKTFLVEAHSIAAKRQARRDQHTSVTSNPD